jgi:hypothetical protein
MEGGEAVKLTITGRGVILTVTWAVAVPPKFLAVRV